MNIEIQVNAFSASGNELSKLSDKEITKAISLSVGNIVIPNINKSKDKYNDKII